VDTFYYVTGDVNNILSKSGCDIILLVGNDARINQTFSLKHTIRHVLDSCLRAGTILKTDGISNVLTKWTSNFLRHSLGDGHSSDSTRLSTAYLTSVCIVRFCKILNHLGGLPRPSVSNLRKNTIGMALRDDILRVTASCGT
jgi:hypothetical protein